MQKNIAVLRGDGIGPEIMEEALRCLDAVERRFGHSFATSEALLGGAAIDAVGAPLPAETLAVCKASDAVLLGAVGGPKWEHLPGDARPEKGLLGLRQGLGVYANLRPATLFPQLAAASPLRADIAAAGIDFLVVRELIGGIYFGVHKTEEKGGQQVATDVMEYSESEIERILHVAFGAAQKRRGKVTSVDKANVLDTSRLWRAVAGRVAQQYPSVEFENMLVDNAAMQIVKNPAQFDVVVTENMFGDILTDEASMITGSIGMIPSASLGAPGAPGLFEPIHGSAPDIAGKNLANPVGTILSVGMMLRYSLGMPTEADAVEAAVLAVLESGLRTADAAGPDDVPVGCEEMGRAVAAAIGKA
ncbi:3-isopropylmalate dehydrogenase [Ruminococcaceae bacterium OttesenSCG-928-O06]|nr:3-isopropylmalate dehydrogenase [Ruminococcaceae bacterium OttesenSCG-928-O06]